MNLLCWNYFLLALLGNGFFSSSVDFAFFCRTASPKAAVEWPTEKIYPECQAYASLEKGFYLLRSFFLVFYRTRLLSLTSFGVIHLWCSQKNDQFYDPPPPPSPRACPFYSQKWTIDIFCLKHENTKNLWDKFQDPLPTFAWTS